MEVTQPKAEKGKDRPLLFSAAEAAHLCGCSERTWRAWDSSGHIPRSLTIGRSKYWRPEELKAWVRDGCPKRNIWDAGLEGKTF